MGASENALSLAVAARALGVPRQRGMTLPEYKVAWRWCRDFIVRHCIERGDMPAKRRGERYAWMLYLRWGLYNAEFLEAASEMLLFRMRACLGWQFQLSGPETAAAPLLCGVARAALDCGFPLATFIVRKEQKSYGRMNWIEGMPNSAPVALTDDLCNSSEALAHAHRIVLKEKLTPARHAFVLVNKFNARQHHAQRAHSDLYLPKDYRVHSLYTLDDIGLGGASH